MSHYKVNQDRTYFDFYNGDVRIWIEQGEIHMKAVDNRSKTDPVELTPTMARQIVAVLLELADRTDD